MKFIYNKNDYRQLVGKNYSVDGLQQYQVFVTFLNTIFDVSFLLFRCMINYFNQFQVFARYFE